MAKATRINPKNPMMRANQDGGPARPAVASAKMPKPSQDAQAQEYVAPAIWSPLVRLTGKHPVLRQARNAQAEYDQTESGPDAGRDLDETVHVARLLY